MYYNPYEFFNNLPLNYLYAIFVFICIILFMSVFKFILVIKLKKIADNTKNDLDDVLVKIALKFNWIFYFSVALYVSLLFFNISGKIKVTINTIFFIIIAYQIIRSFHILINYFAEKYQHYYKKEDSTGIILFSKLVQLSLWFIAVLIILSNLGYNITTLLAGLGIGGIAVALAIQNILTDIFSSISIYFDKPFKIGDFIVIGNNSGTIKKIGIKTTRLITPQGDELIVSNKELTSVRIENFKKMEHRRVTFRFDVDKDTSLANLNKIKKIIPEIINNIDKASTERVHLKFLESYKLVYEVVYSVHSNNYMLFRDIQEIINLEIIKQFRKNKIKFFDKVYILENKEKI